MQIQEGQTVKCKSKHETTPFSVLPLFRRACPSFTEQCKAEKGKAQEK